MIMDTSKNYYETVMRDFTMYARGRTLEQYCRIITRFQLLLLLNGAVRTKLKID